jgi:hypothetical protein
MFEGFSDSATKCTSPLTLKITNTNVELSSNMADYIENFYNPPRRHSSLNYLTPNEFVALTA